MRREMATHNTERNLESAAPATAARVRAIWSDSSRPASERKSMMFSLWVEAPRPPWTRETHWLRRRQTRLAMRGIAIGLAVQRLLPKGSADPYTKAELSPLSAGHAANRRFTPYVAH